MSRRARVVVAGNGMVSHRFCAALTDRAPGRFEIVVLGEEAHPAYDRTRLTDLLGEGKLDDLVLAPPAWYEQRRISLRLGDPVKAIDRADRCVLTRSGRLERYEHLVLATGAAAAVPPVAGSDLAGVFAYRSAADLSSIALYARRASSVAVLGGGPLGIEAAVALRALGLHVVLLEAAPHLLRRQLDAASAEVVAAELAATGVQVSCGVELRAIRAKPGGLIVDVVGWPPLPVQMVVLATGVRARDELARAAGLAVDHRRGGVAVDDQLRTSDPKIFAIGDCASHVGISYGTVAPGYSMADVAADRLAGGEASFTGAERAVRMRAGGLEIVSIGDATVADDDRHEAVVYEGGRRRRAITLSDGVVTGLHAIGPWPELAEVEQVMLDRRPLTPRERAAFRDSGQPFARGSIAMRAVPICHCVGVTYAELCGARASGASTVAELSARTGAGLRCGGCVPRLEQIVAGEALTPIRVRGRFSMGLVSLVALGAAVVFALAIVLGRRGEVVDLIPPLRFRDQLWSGIVLAGASAATLILSLRRRIRALRRLGALPWYRVLHGAIGAGSVALLVGHTQLRAGDNLNRLLLGCFLAVIASGAAFGFTTAAIGRAGRMGRALHALTSACHWLFLWALPVLLVFHVLAVVWF